MSDTATIMLTNLEKKQQKHTRCTQNEIPDSVTLTQNTVNSELRYRAAGPHKKSVEALIATVLCRLHVLRHF